MLGLSNSAQKIRIRATISPLKAQAFGRLCRSRNSPPRVFFGRNVNLLRMQHTLTQTGCFKSNGISPTTEFLAASAHHWMPHFIQSNGCVMAMLRCTSASVGPGGSFFQSSM